MDALVRAGVAEGDIYVDTASGARASRPQLDLVLKLLRVGDTLKVTRLDRLGRSVLHLVTLGAELRDRGIDLHVTEQGIDTSTMEGRAMFGMLSVLAELQRELIVANTRDGLAAARPRPRRRPQAQAQRRPGSARPGALRRRQAHRPADRGDLRCTPLHRLRLPRQDRSRPAGRRGGGQGRVMSARATRPPSYLARLLAELDEIHAVYAKVRRYGGLRGRRPPRRMHRPGRAAPPARTLSVAPRLAAVYLAAILTVVFALDDTATPS